MKALALLALLAAACLPARDARPRTGWELTRPSVVVILGHLGGGGVCSGVVVRNNAGRPVVATAGHCVSHPLDPSIEDGPGIAELGQPVWFQVRGEWLARRGTLVTFDARRDRCTVEAEDLPPPLAKAKMFDTWEASDIPVQVRAVSALFERTALGVVTGEAYADANTYFWDASLAVDHGWSGSPVLNRAGQVVGLVILCRADWVGNHKVCTGTAAVFTDIP